MCSNACIFVKQFRRAERLRQPDQRHHCTDTTTSPTSTTTPRFALHQTGLHRPEHTTSSCTTTSSYVKIIVEFYIANTNIAKVYINVVFRRRRQKPHRRRDLRSPPPPMTRPAAAVIFDRRRRLRQDLPPLQNRCRCRLKTRRRRRIPAAAAQNPPPPQNTCRRRLKTRRHRSNPAAAA
jgi:hypothetical protein